LSVSPRKILEEIKLSKSIIKAGVISLTGLMTAGCVVYERPRPVVYERPAYQETVVVGPGVEVIEVEPAPAERVYVYDVGYPPGVYVYGGYYYYNGNRYEHDVFVNRVVTVNIRENRYVNVEENRRAGVQIEAQHRNAYAVNHGHPANTARAAAPARAGEPRTGEARTGEPRTGEPAHAAARPAAKRPEVDKRKPGAEACVRE